jgi:hypothetical protein
MPSSTGRPRRRIAIARTATARCHHLVPILAFWTGLDFSLGADLALAVHLSADVPLENVHSDLDAGTGQKSRVLELYAVRPGAALGLAYSS